MEAAGYVTDVLRPRRVKQHEELLPSFANEMFPELQRLLPKLNPLRRSDREKLNDPHVPREILEALAD